MVKILFPLDFNPCCIQCWHLWYPPKHHPPLYNGPEKMHQVVPGQPWVVPIHPLTRWENSWFSAFLPWWLSRWPRPLPENTQWIRKVCESTPRISQRVEGRYSTHAKCKQYLTSKYGMFRNRKGNGGTGEDSGETVNRGLAWLWHLT